MKTKLALREGFWQEERRPELPMPIPRDKPWKGMKRFLKALERVQDKAEGSDRNSARIIAYRGWSNCRLCGQKNGHEEFHVDGWVWPAGYGHYIEVHNVRPSLAFQEFIEGREVGENVD